MTRRSLCSSCAVALLFLVAPLGVEPAFAENPSLAPTPIELANDWVLSDGLCDPETALYDPAREALIVSNICEYARNGLGYLSLVALDGTMVDARWLEGLDSPAGLAMAGDRVYVADFDSVRVVDRETGTLVETIGFPFEVRALNDVAVDAGGTIYVSDSAAGGVHRVIGGVGQAWIEDDRLKSANGLHVVDGHLYVGGDSLYRVEIATGRILERIGPEALADIDGIESDGRGGLVLAIVGGPVWHLPSGWPDGAPPAVYTSPGLSSTNHAFLPGRDLVVVPTGFDDTLIAFTLPRP